jgi:two-component system response regulator YesN
VPRTLNILAVDDELPVTWSIRFALSHPTRTFASAGNGEEALAKIQGGPPPFDIVITDNTMPRMNGLEFVRRLRELRFAGKIIVLSANLSGEITRAYEALNVDRLLPKPFNVAELRQMIDELAQAA